MVEKGCRIGEMKSLYRSILGSEGYMNVTRTTSAPEVLKSWLEGRERKKERKSNVNKMQMAKM